MICPVIEKGENWFCPKCGWERPKSLFRFPPRRDCGNPMQQSSIFPTSPPSPLNFVSKKLRPNVESMKIRGPTRTDAEVLFIITNYCQWCESWNPDAPKKKCKSCGCGSTETVENLHERRIKNCPRQDSPAAWTEESLQRNFAGQPDDSSPKST